MTEERQKTPDAAMAVLDSVAALRAFVAAERARGARVALVPTMGALHDGHMALVRRGLALADTVIATIFVNPTQFGPGEDFSAYPRSWDSDRALLAAQGAGAVFLPSVAEIYPDGFSTTVTLRGVTAPLEGAHRPGHFDGVATVVAKLLLMALPDVALFGEKDWQQLQVIRLMVADLNIPVAIEGVPTMRDANGLALSSRNAYLDAAQYAIAVNLNKIMAQMADKIRAGESAEAVESWGAAAVLAAGFDAVDYLCVRDAATLTAPVAAQGAEQGAAHPRRILAAVRLGRARLIDNMAV